ncbi:hypothetical protein [Micromonospora sp. NPDC005173]
MGVVAGSGGFRGVVVGGGIGITSTKAVAAVDQPAADAFACPGSVTH